MKKIIIALSVLFLANVAIAKSDFLANDAQVYKISAMASSSANSTDMSRPLPEFVLAKYDLPVLPRIAHAGGGINGEIYVNSYEALDLNKTFGFELFELDFNWTSDKEIVCIHDWGNTFRKRFNQEPRGPVSLSEFKKLSDEHELYNYCTLDGLAKWLEENPEAKIVTDIKARNVDAMKKFAQTVKNKDQIIVQIYQPDEYQAITDLGFKNIIWTLYMYKGNEADVLVEVENMDVYAITMPKNRASSNLPHKLALMGIASYVHTINDSMAMKHYQNKYGISEIYTDTLKP